MSWIYISIEYIFPTKTIKWNFLVIAFNEFTLNQSKTIERSWSTIYSTADRFGLDFV